MTAPICPAFGTDGIRGITGETITPDLLYRLGQCAAATMGKDGTLALARDGRESGEELAEAFCRGVQSGGNKVCDAGILPSGMLGMLCQRHPDIAMGAVITASHNPSEYNGIKFYSDNGAKFSRQAEKQLLCHWPDSGHSARSDKALTSPALLSTAALCTQMAAELANHLGDNTPLSGLKLAVDCANGAGTAVAEPLLASLGASVTLLNTSGNINTDCGTNHPQQLANHLRNSDADFGIALDGDGDRLVLVTSAGRCLDGDDMLFLHAILQKPVGIVGTIMSNGALKPALRRAGVHFRRSDVGEVPLHKMLVRQGWQIGGEPSGHLLNLTLHSSADGLLNATDLLALLCRQQANPETLLEPFQPLTQTAINVPWPSNMQLSKIESTVLQRRKQLREDGGADSRMIIRPSGTEPVLRIMVETAEVHIGQETAARLADDLTKLTESGRATGGSSLAQSA